MTATDGQTTMGPDPVGQRNGIGHPAPPLPISSLVRGACPSLAAPMPTGDGLLVRLRPSTPGLTIGQFRDLARAAARHGNGLLEITARGNIQLRGLSPQTMPDLATDIDRAGIVPESGLTIETPPLSGRDPAEIADARAMGRRLWQALAALPMDLKLAPKLTVIIDGGGHFGLDGLSADIRLKALTSDRWQISVGGMGASGLRVSVGEADDVLAAVIELLKSLAAIGPRARGRDLATALSQRQSDTLPAQRLSPSLGSLEAITCKSTVGVSSEPDIASPLLPSGRRCPPGQMRGRAQGATFSLPFRLRRRPPHRLAFARHFSPLGRRRSKPPIPHISNAKLLPGSPLGVHRLGSDIALLGIVPRYGQISADKLLALLDAAELAGVDEIRPSPRHALLLLGTSSRIAGLQATAIELGFDVDANAPSSRIASCSGAGACASASYRTKDLAADLVERVPELLDGSIGFHLSGCPKGCAHPAAADIAIVGSASGLTVVLNGSADGGPILVTDKIGLKSALRRLAALVGDSKGANESVKACLKRLGGNAVAAALRQE